MKNKVVLTIYFFDYLTVYKFTCSHVLTIYFFDYLTVYKFTYSYSLIHFLSSFTLFLKGGKRVFTKINQFLSHHTDIICSSVSWGTNIAEMIKGGHVGTGTQKHSGGIGQ